MNELIAFLQANIIPIYFFYGLAHFVIGVVVAVEATRASQLSLARALPFLAAFELTQGVNEWLKMLSEISQEIPTIAREPLWAVDIKLVLFAASFVCLMWFGVDLLGRLVPHSKRWSVWIPIVSVVLCVLVIWQLRSANELTWFAIDFDVGKLVIRYVLGVPAAIIACVALLAQRRVFLRENMPEFGGDLVGATLALAWYSVFNQIFGPPTNYFPSTIVNKQLFLQITGVPVEIFRFAAIIVFAFFIMRTMRVFEVEYARRLDAANRARFAAQEESARELSVMFETCRLLGSSLEIQSLLNTFLTPIVTLEPIVGATIYLYDPVERALKIQARRLREGYELSALQRECSKHASQRAFDTGEIAYEAEPQSDISFVSLPLVSQGRTIGTLCLAHQTAFANYTVIQTLARQLGIALENAALYQQVQEKERRRGQLLERAVSAQEEERKRIARELHDDTGQTLTALGVGLSGVEQTIRQDPELAQFQITELKNMTMRAIDNLRQYISDLRPSVLDDMGLVSALRWCATQYTERMKIDVQARIIGTKRRLPAEVETVLFRIAQEGLNNVARHARATHAVVQLEFGDSSVVLTIEDDGCGFDVNEILGSSPNRRAWGLLGVQERVALVGGEFHLSSTPGKGTKLVVEVPIKEEG